MKDLPKAFEPKLSQKKWISFWKEGRFFEADLQSQKKRYSIVIPPPNVTGNLHMGHALVDTLQDVLIRWKRMSGFETLWVVGTDHAGIATQTVVERHLLSTTGKRRKDFHREEFLAHVWAWKEKCEGNILSQVEQLGCSCDFSRLRFTMDEGCNRAVRVVFKKMFDDGLIYRGDYLVNWDPMAQTALSDDEVEHEERDSFLWHIRYPVVGGESLIIATTRPETMLGDTAIAVHPKDERYTHLIGKKVALPLSNREIPIIADSFVDPSFGSGAVKITPAHDFNDFEVGRRANLPMINIMTPDGKIKEGPYQDLTMEEARKRVVADLKELVVKTEPHQLRVGVSYRSKAVIEPYLSKQWFIRMEPFKEKLIAAVKQKKVKLIPEHWEQTYYHWIENLRDWCISRQLWWGHRIPVWYKGEEVLCYDQEGTPPDIDESWSQDPDVLDTWFSSALWPFSALGFPDQKEELQQFYPTSTLITGHDILFFWVARMILMGEYVMKEVPFHESFLHGLIYGKSYWENTDQGVRYLSAQEKREYDLGKTPPSHVQSKWEKMSKSKGNVIDPLELIDTYGADALRLALCSSVTHARQIDLDLRRFEEFKNFANKLWNGARFVLMNLEDFSSEEMEKGLDENLLSLEDRWILSSLRQTVEEIVRGFKEYTFDKASMKGYEFFWNHFCSIYVELCKPVLFSKVGTEDLRKNKQRILSIVLSSSIRLLHPIAPFVTEEIFSALKSHFAHIREKSLDFHTRDFIQSIRSPCCATAPYPEPLGRVDQEAITKFEYLLQVVHQVRNIRAEMGLSFAEKTELWIFSSEHEKKQEIRDHEHILLALTPTTKVVYEELPPSSFAAHALVDSLKLMIPIPESFKEKEKARLEKEKMKLEKILFSTKEKLSNEEFCQKAPAPIIQKMEDTLNQTEKLLSDIRAQLKSF